MHYFFFMVQI